MEEFGSGDFPSMIVTENISTASTIEHSLFPRSPKPENQQKGATNRRCWLRITVYKNTEYREGVDKRDAILHEDIVEFRLLKNRLASYETKNEPSRKSMN
jgi:hypothetical protein